MARLLYMTVPDGTTAMGEFNELDDYYKVLNAHCFDIVSLKIGDKYFSCFVDDDGRLKENQIPSIVHKETGEVIIVGNVVFANFDDDGNAASLSEDDVEMIRNNIAIGMADVGYNRIQVHCVRAEY